MSFEVLRIPFSRAVPWYGPAAAISTIKPFDHTNSSRDVSGHILGCLKKSPDTPAKNDVCTIYLHGFPDQSVDHREECSSSDPANNLYGQFSSRMSKKMSEFFYCFCACTFSGSPGSHSGLKFYDKTVSQEVWDVLNIMSCLSTDKEERQGGPGVGKKGFHIVGLSTGAIIGGVLRGVSKELLGKLGITSPILSISIIAACGVDINQALEYDFDEEQRGDFEKVGYCKKQFWLPDSSKSNPEDAVKVIVESGDGSAGGEQSAEVEQNASTKWLPHMLKLGNQYRDDFLQLPVKQHLADSSGSPIPLLVIHGKEDKSIPFSEGQQVFEMACEPKRFLEIAKGNHLLTNSKDLKKAIMEIQKWHGQWEGKADA